MKKLYPLHQTGASLIEVLVAVLILSFGMLSLGGMMAYGVQLPKLAAYRADAATLAARRARPSVNAASRLKRRKYSSLTM